MEHHDHFKSPIKFELTVTVKPISIVVTHKTDGTELATLTKDLVAHTAALKQTITPP